MRSGITVGLLGLALMASPTVTQAQAAGRMNPMIALHEKGLPVFGITHPTITALHEYEGYCDSGAATGVGGRSEPALTPAALKARMEAGTPPVILDVREPFEHAICRIPGARLIPLGELPGRLSELNPGDEIVVHCKSGGRSARAVALLREHGYGRAANLTGGILAWINEIDPSLLRY